MEPALNAPRASVMATIQLLAKDNKVCFISNLRILAELKHVETILNMWIRFLYETFKMPFKNFELSLNMYSNVLNNRRLLIIIWAEIKSDVRAQ